MAEGAFGEWLRCDPFMRDGIGVRIKYHPCLTVPLDNTRVQGGDVAMLDEKAYSLDHQYRVLVALRLPSCNLLRRLPCACKQETWACPFSRAYLLRIWSSCGDGSLQTEDEIRAYKLLTTFNGPYQVLHQGPHQDGFERTYMT